MTEMATAPNSGIPVGYRKKITGDEQATKHAAGIVFVAPDGDILLLRRGGTEGKDNYVGHWALPGGGVEEGETPETGAAREAREEMGVDVDLGGMKPLDRRISPTGTAFHTFARTVDEKFVPKLNSEHNGYAWAPLNMLPRPMHPAVEQTLRDQVGLADDMKSEDWAELRDGFLKWTREEETESEHATDRFSFDEVKHDPANGQFTSGGGSSSGKKDDEPKKVGTTAIGSKLSFVNEFLKTHQSMAEQSSYLEKQSPEKLRTALSLIEKHGAIDPNSQHVKKMITAALGKDSAVSKTAGDSALTLALDKDSVRMKRRDGQLHVIKAHISKANVCPYKGKEIPGFSALGLDPDKIYMLLRDPEELRKGAATSNGVQLLRKHVPVDAKDHKPYDTVGSLGTDAEFDGTYLDNSLFVNAQDAIDGIESGEQRQLSAGYHYKPDMTPGSFNGEKFDGVMREIVFNHVALVESGRAGPDVLVGDSMEQMQWGVIESALEEFLSHV